MTLTGGVRDVNVCVHRKMNLLISNSFSFFFKLFYQCLRHNHCTNKETRKYLILVYILRSLYNFT